MQPADRSLQDGGRPQVFEYEPVTARSSFAPEFYSSPVYAVSGDPPPQEEIINLILRLRTSQKPRKDVVPAEAHKSRVDALAYRLREIREAMLMDAYRDEQPGIHIAYRTDGHLLNSRRMQAPTRVSTGTVHDFLFADDCALNTVTKEDMQRSMDLFVAGCADFGLTISTTKMVVMHQPPPSAEYNASRINVNGAQLKNVETFASCRATRESMTSTSGICLLIPTTEESACELVVHVRINGLTT
ncbi:unnamed protein product [Schistocephalus solidus]|uniref:Reverse transcriptase domain-containing protein n=1 Tax=Schistocephalus solidus TaxID=70667 RepID=A0A183SF06_SCHSO|nr:unnamed protein product [Schistocephalus solidus]